MRNIIVGTRQSALAVTQTGQVITQLQEVGKENDISCSFDVKKIVTRGDKILDVTLSKVGGKGLFVKEIEQALLNGEIDIAVHSMKDMPAELPDGLVIGGIPERVDPRDCLMTRGDLKLSELPEGAVIGTSSLRRACQLKSYRSDFEIKPIRGNIDSRMRKLETEGFDAIVLATAGLHRMGWADRISDYLPSHICLPAVGQGALAIQCRSDDEFVLDLLRKYEHGPTALAIAAERSFLGRLNGGCQVPIGAFATVAAPLFDGDLPLITLTGMVGAPDGSTVLKDTMRGNDAGKLGIALADELRSRGADDLLAQFGG